MPHAAFDFTTVLDRRAVPGEKWDRYAGRDVLPMWVADMDFAAPPCVIEALKQRLDHRVFGYTDAWPSLKDAIVDAMARDYAWAVDPSWIVFLPGMVAGFNVACRLAGEAGDGVITAAPVYPPMLAAPGHHNRALQRVDLVPGPSGAYGWDLEALAAVATPRSRLFLLCNPHNPVGRVYTRPELEALARFAEERDLLICSDEIHCGLVLDPETRHIPIATLGPEVARRTITLMAPSKTWNIPGLYCAFAIIPAPELRSRYRRAMRGIVPHVNIFGMVAAEAAYRDGEPWRHALIDVLRGHRDQVMACLAAFPELTVVSPEATYLAWIDCRRMMAERGIADPVAFFEAAGVGLSDGSPFGAPGFVRLNFGCPGTTLDEGLARMARALA